MMTRQITAIGKVTFQELLREKILWSSFVFGLFSVVLAYFVSRLSFAENARLALDFGLTAISLIGGLIAVIMGATLIAKEVQSRTHYTVLTKPVHRWQFVIGRVTGLFGVLAVNATLMTLILVVVFSLSHGRLTLQIGQSLILQVVEFAVLATVACVFSTFTTSTLAAVFATGIWVCGHAMEDIRILSNKIEPYAIRPVLKAIVAIFPDLSRFDIKAEVSHMIPVSATTFSLSLSYGVLYALFMLAAACFLFSRREL